MPHDPSTQTTIEGAVVDSKARRAKWVVDGIYTRLDGKEPSRAFITRVKRSSESEDESETLREWLGGDE